MANRKILIAMDGSKQSLYALSYYKSNVQHAGDDLVVVFCMEAGMEDEEANLKQKLEKMISDLGLTGRAVRYSGSTPGEAVIKAAEELQVAMVITGTRGLGKLRRTIMGSVSQYVVHHAHVPVLVCREK